MTRSVIPACFKRGSKILKAAVLTASDRSFRGEREDTSGVLLQQWLQNQKAEVLYKIVPDDKEILKEALCKMADVLQCHVILTTGGTGLGVRDNTPEATREVLEKEIPGIAEALRQEGSKKTPMAILSRGLAGIRGNTLIINLPGSPNAVKDAMKILEPVLHHAVELMQGRVKDCSPLISH